MQNFRAKVWESFRGNFRPKFRGKVSWKFREFVRAATGLMQWVSTTLPPLQPNVVPLQPPTEIHQQKGKNKWYMQPSLRGKVSTCKDHRIGKMSVIDIATSTGELPPYPTAARRRRRRCHCGGGRLAAGGERAVRRAGGPGGGRRQLSSVILHNSICMYN